jgi:hypothetical protein
MPHAVPRDSPFDFYSPTRSIPKMDARQMQLPMPQPVMPHHGLDSLRTTRRQPVTPPAENMGSTGGAVAFPPSGGRTYDVGYQLPSIGDSRTVSGRTSPTPQRQPPPQAQQPAQDMSQQRKKWTISPNLRIPLTISTPQEGLPQLAAEVSLEDGSNLRANANRLRLHVFSGSRAQPRSSRC